jgi:predicted kinase
MRRLPDERRLSSLVADPARAPGIDVPGQLDEVAHLLAGLHARSAPVLRTAPVAEQALARWEHESSELRLLADGRLDPGLVHEARALGRSWLAGRADLLRERARAGWTRDGHGDLLADDVFCLDDGPRVLDCLDFDEQLRIGDVLADAAFLVMDLEHHGAPVLAARFLRAWQGLLGETHPPALADHLVAVRALLRAKTGCLRARQLGAGQAVDAERHLRLAVAHLRRAVPRLVLVGGLPGTGKTTLAAALAARTGARVLSSDVLRAERGPRPDRYAPAQVQAVYDALLARAAGLLARGEHVVLDATWLDPDRRAEAARTAERAGAALVPLRCSAPLPVAEARVRDRLQRGDDASEATPLVLEALAARAAERHDDWSDASRVDTTRTDAVERAADLVGTGWQPELADVGGARP